ncbi:MAG: hypothetical protein WBF67_03555 [Olleya sp.]
MRKVASALILICFLSFLYNCSKENDVENSIEPIQTDVSISTSLNVISWVDYNDLAQNLQNALSYNYGTTPETATIKQQIFNADTTQVVASIIIKPEFQSTYNDTNPSNNAVTIILDKIITTPQGVELNADGPGNTYNLITSVLAPGANPIETPDCGHTAFGNHIDEIFDTDLNDNVFRFFIHTTPDNDRCINFDRQRNEIKTYDQSPANLKGTENETVIYSWKFKLNTGFLSSPNFTHLHQLKSVGGALESMPMYTLTTRKGTPDKLELRYAETDSQTTLAETSLEPFIGHWLEVNETIKYGTSGTYQIEIKNLSDGTVLLAYTNNSIINWRPNADFVRPKWGIYRSLINQQDLRDEEVLFANFKITEIE